MRACSRCLDLLLKYRPSAVQFPIVVSQDCGHEPTARAIREYNNRGIELIQVLSLSWLCAVYAHHGHCLRLV